MKGFLGLLTIAVAISNVELFVLRDQVCRGVPNGELVPHPLNCRLFYYCVHSRAVLRICPWILHFNPQKQVCDWPEDAGCQIRTTTSPEPTTPEPTTPEPTTPEPTTPNSTSSEDWPTSPEPETSTPNWPTSPEPETTTPNSTSSEDWPTSPEPETSTPNWPTSPEPETTTPNSTSSEDWPTSPEPETSTPNSTSSEDWPTSPEPEISTLNSTSSEDWPTSPEPETIFSICGGLPHGELVLHPTDCSKFYQCLGFKPVEKSCPDGLLFNPREKVCDYPQNAGCIINM